MTEKKKRRTIPDPPRVTYYHAADGSHSAAYVQWDLGSGILYTGETTAIVEQKVAADIEAHAERIARNEAAKVARIMGRVKKNLAEAAR